MESDDHKEREFILDMVKGYFGTGTGPSFKGIDAKRLERLMAKTALDGLGHVYFKDRKDVPPRLRRRMKQAYDLVSRFDIGYLEMIDRFSRSNEKKILFKEYVYKIGKDYKKGTRYSCDIDLILDPEEFYGFDNFLKKEGFFSDGVEFSFDFIKSLGYEANEDVLKRDDIYPKMMTEIRKKYRNYDVDWKVSLAKTLDSKIFGIRENFRKDPDAAVKRIEALKKRFGDIEEINNSINRVMKLKSYMPREKSAGYHKLDRNHVHYFLDIHTKLFRDRCPFWLRYEDLSSKKVKGSLYALKIEDSIVADACHYCLNLNNYGEHSFQGFLKYLVDLAYKSRLKKIDWDRIIKVSKNGGCSSQTWFYLSLAKGYLDANVPEEVLRRLKRDGSQLQNFLLSRIDAERLLFNERSMFVHIYSFLFLGRSIPRSLGMNPLSRLVLLVDKKFRN